MIFVTLAIGRSFAAFCSNKTVPVAASINSALEAVSVRTGAAVCSAVMSEAVSASACRGCLWHKNGVFRSVVHSSMQEREKQQRQWRNNQSKK